MNAVVNHLYISYETQKELHSSLLHHRDLGRLRDGATSMVLYDVDGVIRRRWWYTTSMVVYDVGGGIRRRWWDSAIAMTRYIVRCEVWVNVCWCDGNGAKTMVWWRLRNGATVQWRWRDNAMIRWRWCDNAMPMARWHDDYVAMLYRVIVSAPSHHRHLVIAPSRYRLFCACAIKKKNGVR